MFDDIVLNAIQKENARELVKGLLNMVEQLRVCPKKQLEHFEIIISISETRGII